MKSFLFAILSVGVTVCVCRGQNKENPPSIMIWYDSYGLNARNTKMVDGKPVLLCLGPQLLAAAWDNGDFLWSTNAIYGGEPYFYGKTEKPDSVKELLDSWVKKGWLSAECSQHHVGLSAQYIGMLISSGTNTLKALSWHEIYEENTNLVATASGIRTLDGRTREEAIKKPCACGRCVMNSEQKAEIAAYMQFRAMWAEIREQVRLLIPPAGDVAEGAKVLPILRQTITSPYPK